MKFGIDVSKHQGVINWTKVKPQIDFAIIQAGYGREFDPRGLENIIVCESLGIPYGIYWASYSTTPEKARQEAEKLHNFIMDNNLKPTYPIYYDFEDFSLNYMRGQGVNPTKELIEKIVLSFCDYMSERKYYVGVYTDHSTRKKWLNEIIFKRYDFWSAYWTSNPSHPYPVNLWQYSNNGIINGINGRVDTNRAYLDFPKIIRERGLNNTTQPEKAIITITVTNVSELESIKSLLDSNNVKYKEG